MATRALAAVLAVLALGAGGIAQGQIPASLSEETQMAVEGAIPSVLPALVRIHVVEVDYESGREVKSEATGSGVIFAADGYVITNHHVAGHAKHLVCKLADKQEVDAEMIGTDPLTDVSVLKLMPKQKREFPVARFGDSSKLKVGDTVLAMGSPLALSQSVTLGIVSNTALVMPDLFWPFRFELEGEDVGSIVRWIGHDAMLNPGNSGGPLVNLDGEVVGINEMKFGLGAAIPGNLAKQVAEQLVRDRTVTRAWLGLDVQPLLKSQAGMKGALVSGTIPGSPAEKAGFRSGDILVSLAGREVNVAWPEELPLLNQLVADLPIGEKVEAIVTRGDERVSLTVAPEQREPARPRDREFVEWGMTGRDLSLLEAKELRRPTRDGVLVTSIRPGGPCEDARPRILESDVILEVGGKPVRNVQELGEVTKAVTKEAKEPVPVTVLMDRRAESYLTVVKVGKKPVPEPAGEVRKAWIGLNTQVLTREMAEALKLGDTTGVRVTQVLPGTTAEKAGLRVGDLVTAMDGEKIPAFRPEHYDVFPAMVRRYDVGSEVEFTILREGQENRLRATLEEAPRPPREMKSYRDDSLEFSARDVAAEDRVRQQLKAEDQGVLIESVSEGGWAALAHLAVGDLVFEVDGQPTPTIAVFEARMRQVVANKPETIVLRVRRGIHTLHIELTPKWVDSNAPGSQDGWR